MADLRKALIVIAVIPHTAKTTTLGQKRIGGRVNIEVDVLSKYVEKHLNKVQQVGISEETLNRAGFMPMGWIEN